jgi:hypothetical protein
MLVRLGLFALALSSASAAMSMQSMQQSEYPQARTVEPVTFWEPQPVYPVERASYLFGQCINRGMSSIDATLSAEAEAASLMNACAAQLRDVRQEALRVIADAHWPEARKDVARAELRARLALVEQRVAARISERRSRTASASR